MNTQEFLHLLRENSNLPLVFEYEENKRVPVGYHITEVKNVTIDSVDCGANTHFEQQTVIQLWDGSGVAENGKTFTAGKAVGILDKVGQIKPLKLETQIFLEYGNSLLNTSQFQVADTKISDHELVISMKAPSTVCKPRELAFFSQETEGCCTPGGGCC